MGIESGKVVTVKGNVEPKCLGKVMMHEHLYMHTYDWENECIPKTELPDLPRERQRFMDELLPYVAQLKDHGCRCIVDASFMPSRAHPSFYTELSEKAGIHVVLATGYYREIELGTYFAKSPEGQIWESVRTASVEELSDLLVCDIVEGMHGTEIRSGAIKLATSQPEMTKAEVKAFQAGARAHKETGVHITTHCTEKGAETTQLELLDREGVDLSRVVIGHTAGHLMDEECRKSCISWMKRGANFLPTNLGISEADPQGTKWVELIEAIHDVFDKGLGEHIVMGLDASFAATHGPGPFKFRNTPPPPYLHMFTHTLPVFRKLSLSKDEEEMIMEKNPHRILAIQ